MQLQSLKILIIKNNVLNYGVEIHLILLPIKTKTISESDDITDLIIYSLLKEKLSLEKGDILAISGKIVALCNGYTIDLKNIIPSTQSQKMAKTYGLDPKFIELILKQSDSIHGGVNKALLTKKQGILIANAGIDLKNAPEGKVILWPDNPNLQAEIIRKALIKKLGIKLGIIIVDSGLYPLRTGTIGLAIGIAGFNPVKDYRKTKDIYGKPIHITRLNNADDLAAASHIYMGEGKEHIPLVIIRNAPITLKDTYNPDQVKLPDDECIYMNNISKKL